MEFKIGDVVRLKSGGHSMTVTKLKDGQEAWCAWFAIGTGDEGPHKKIFPLLALNKVEQ